MILKQLTPGMRKLVHKTTSVFWVDPGYRLHSQKRVPLQGSRGVTDTPFYSCLYMLYMLPDLLYMLPDYLTIGPGSAPGV